MSFLAPLFFVGLAALAIPVLLHLIQRERRRVIAFPSLMFLQRIPYKSVRRRQIRHWLLLALRLAVLLLVVTAFARPYLRRGSVGASAAMGPREVVVLLDRSYSMGHGDRWTRAQTAAAGVVDSLVAAERASIVLFATDAQADVRSSSDRTRLRRAVDDAAPGAGATRYGPALRLAQSVLAASNLPRRELVLVSDFQAVGWNRDDAVRLPAGTTVTTVDVGGTALANTAVTSVAQQRTVFAGQERITVTAAVANRGDAIATGVAVALELGGRVIETQRVDIEAHAGTSVAFAPFSVTAGNTRGSVSAAADALPIDDRFDFVVSPARVVPVVLAGRTATDAAGLYVARALAIGSAPRFDVRGAAVAALPLDQVREGSVLVLNDVALSGSDLAAVRTAVEGGAGLLVVAGERAAWAGDGGILPGVPGAPVDRTTRVGVLTSLNASHPVFEPFQGPRRGDFSSARFFRYRPVTLREDAAVLARFDDGAVALAERRVGRGRVLLWTSSLDTSWNDFALRPVFLPFLHRVARYVGQYTEPVSALTVGDLLDPSTLPLVPGSARPSTRALVLTPSGQRLALGEGETGVIALEEKGFFEVRANDSADPLVVAANVDPAESDPARIAPGEIATSMGGATGGTATAGAALAPEDEERQTGLWWYLLIGAVLLLAGETVLANRYSGVRS